MPRADVVDAPDVKTTITVINRRCRQGKFCKIISIILALSDKIKKTFSHGNDVATALDQLQTFDFTYFKPSLQISQSMDEEMKILENEQFRIEFKTLFDVYVKQEQIYHASLSKSYAFLLDQCSKATQHKIESRQDVDDDIMNNPIKLLNAIKAHALNYLDKKYTMLIIMDALRAFATTKQKVGESCFGDSSGQPYYLNKFITKMNGFGSESEKNHPELASTAFE
jgi:hypothetical protein